MIVALPVAPEVTHVSQLVCEVAVKAQLGALAVTLIEPLPPPAAADA